jgi:hypothetical protein
MFGLASAQADAGTESVGGWSRLWIETQQTGNREGRGNIHTDRPLYKIRHFGYLTQNNPACAGQST